MDDAFTPIRLHEILGERPFRFFEQITSTQDAAYEWAMTDPTLPGTRPGDRHAVVIAEQQTAGRGRQGRTWVSPPQSSIMVSVILKPALAPEHLPRVTMLGALAVADVLRPLLGEALSLKWPNDVLIRGKKVCGILAESTWIGDRLAAVILGIGLNVRVNFDGHSLIYPATSLEAELGQPVNRLDLLRSLLDRVDNWAALLGEPLLDRHVARQPGYTRQACSCGYRAGQSAESVLTPAPRKRSMTAARCWCGWIRASCGGWSRRMSGWRKNQPMPMPILILLAVSPKRFTFHSANSNTFLTSAIYSMDWTSDRTTSCAGVSLCPTSDVVYAEKEMIPVCSTSEVCGLSSCRWWR